MNLAIVGCGFVADYYGLTLPNHPELKLLGVMDREAHRAAHFAKVYSVAKYETLSDLLADERVEMVLNLTNPRSHYQVSKASLAANKHVYSEKPLGMELEEARDLVETAEAKGLYLTSAPCNVLSESAQTIWKLLRQGKIGTTRLAYAELDYGLIHRMRYLKWRSQSGIPWPWKDEFEVGCTLEHAGYYVTWLVAFFGSATRVTASSHCLVPDKETAEPITAMAPDFASACIEFESGVVARLTCSIVAPHDHQLRIFGDEGVIAVKECWNYHSPVYLKKRTPLALRLEKWPWVAKAFGFDFRKVPLVRPVSYRHRYRGTTTMNFARGVAVLAKAAREGRPPILSARFALHVNEIVLAIQNPSTLGCPYTMSTKVESVQPMPWA